jgi:hypothetical protein
MLTARRSSTFETNSGPLSTLMRHGGSRRAAMPTIGRDFLKLAGPSSASQQVIRRAIGTWPFARMAYSVELTLVQFSAWSFCGLTTTRVEFEVVEGGRAAVVFADKDAQAASSQAEASDHSE